MFALFVYLLLFLILITLSIGVKHSAPHRSNNVWKVVYTYYILIVFGLIVGLRWDVGRDYMEYFHLIKGDVDFWSYNRLEPMGKWTILFVQSSKWPYFVWFVVMAVIQIYFVILTFSKKVLHLLPFGIFCFLAYMLNFDMNVIRQGCALSIALYAYTFISEKKWVQFIFWIMVASLFHKTAIIFLPIYFVGYSKRIPSIKFQLFIYFILFYWGAVFVQWLIDATGLYWGLFDYELKLEQLAGHEYAIKTGSGIGVLFNYLKFLLIIIMSEKMAHYYNDAGFALFYNIFFIGVCMYSATMNDIFLDRMCRYFTICDVIVSSYLFHYLLTVNRRYNLIGYIFLMGIITLTTYDVLTGKDWQFVNLF